MRILLAALMALCGTVGVATAADLDWRSGRTYTGQPPYFSLYEPWSVEEERPPRRGIYGGSLPPIPPNVSYLVPMNPAFRNDLPAPWTPAWYEYCSRRFASFNPNTGTVQTPDGVRMCF